MRHRVAHRKLGRVTSHRLATLRSMATSLFEHERIRTTLMKAKELRPYAEKLITLAKRDEGQLAARRQVAKSIRDPKIIQKLFDTLGSRFATRPGGYMRILRLGPRKGDGAEMAIVELLGSEYQPGKKDEKDKKKGEKSDAKETKESKAKDEDEKAEEKPKRSRKKKEAEAEAE
jgi:large subunit ribosomal protein L17